MGFNYLQTDDRDDYFKSLNNRDNKKRSSGITLISKEVRSYLIMSQCLK